MEIPETDDELLTQCDVETFRSSGPGGQHVNTRDSAVRIRHRPSGIVIVAREERSQHRNRSIALERLRRRLLERQRPQRPRIPTRMSRAKKARNLEEKRRQGQKKSLRRPPSRED